MDRPIARRRFCETLPLPTGRVRPIRISHAGIVQALNVGVRAARGKLIARMDADDLCYPDRFERQLRFLDEYPKCVAVGSAVMLVDPYNSTLWKIDVKTQHADIDADLLTQWLGAVPSHRILSRQAILDVGGYRAEYQWAEDLDLFCAWRKLAGSRTFPTHCCDIASILRA